MNYSHLLHDVEQFFSQKVTAQGPIPQGADYNSSGAQEMRFQQFLRLLEPGAAFSMNDYGCGYGALAHYLRQRAWDFRYHGFDISAPMIAHARQLTPPEVDWTFATDPATLTPADYTIACGVFNLKFAAAAEAWTAYILETLGTMARLSTRGFGFNMLTKYSDADRMRPDLYYGDPLFFFDYCHTHFARSTALLHDYGLFDFTILVRLG